MEQFNNPGLLSSLIGALHEQWKDLIKFEKIYETEYSHRYFRQLYFNNVVINSANCKS